MVFFNQIMIYLLFLFFVWSLLLINSPLFLPCLLHTTHLACQLPRCFCGCLVLNFVVSLVLGTENPVPVSVHYRSMLADNPISWNHTHNNTMVKTWVLVFLSTLLLRPFVLRMGNGMLWEIVVVVEYHNYRTSE